MDRSTGHYRTLVEDGRDAQYVPPGFLAYTANGSLHAARFDPTSLTVNGDRSVGDKQVLTAVGSGVAEYSVARNGTLVYVSGKSTLTQLNHVLVWVDRQGREHPSTAPERAYWAPRLSPDGSKLAVEIRDQDQDIWIWDIARDVLTRLTSSPLFDQAPVWSPDSKYVFYSSLTGGSVMNVHRQGADGSGLAERVFAGPNIQLPTSITPDGLQLVVTENMLATANDVNLLTPSSRSFIRRPSRCPAHCPRTADGWRTRRSTRRPMSMCVRSRTSTTHDGRFQAVAVRSRRGHATDMS